MPLTLTVLGCTGSYPGPDGACSGYLVQGGGLAVVVDLGPGTLSALQHHIGLDEISAVILTHHHPDHWTDLGVLRTAWRWGLDRMGLPVFGTADTRALADRLTDGLAPTMTWTDVDDGSEVAIGPLVIRFSATDHYVPTLAVRVDFEGASLAYSADTGPGWSFGALGEGIGTALCESSLLDDERLEGAEQVLHLTAGEAGHMAWAAGVGRLLLTHLPAGSDPDEHRVEAEAAFGAPVEVVSQHQTYEIPPTLPEIA
jgi:ribonuclease BN (tRNA processing enzyme)